MITSPIRPDEPFAGLHASIEHAAHVLPTQGPITEFVHHNTLHAFQHLPFHEALAAAADVFETRSYLPEETYRQHLATGRILREELDDELAASRARRGVPRGCAEVGDADLETPRLLHEVGAHTVAELSWRAEEHDALTSLRAELDAGARTRIVQDVRRWLASRDESAENGDVVREAERLLEDRSVARTVESEPERAAAAIYHAITRVGVRSLAHRSLEGGRSGLRSHRDLLRELTSDDPAAIANDVVIRLVASFLDHGFATWPMPNRSRGLYRAWLELAAHTPLEGKTWLRGIRSTARALIEKNASAEEAILSFLAQLGVTEQEQAGYLERVLLELPGWAGLLRRLEQDPSTFAGDDRPAPKLVDYVAVRLAYDVLAIGSVVKAAFGKHAPPLAELRPFLEARRRAEREEPHDLTAFRLAEIFQLAGVVPSDVACLSLPELERVLDRLESFTAAERGRVFHQAYERRYYVEVLDGIAANRVRGRSSAPARTAQVWFCIDDREESIRRHLEEGAPEVETVGVAGFFGLPMRFRGIDDPREKVLCPVNVVPSHFVHEVPEARTEGHAKRRARRRSILGRLASFFGVGSRGLARGLLLTPWLGFAAGFGLLVRVYFPRLASRMVQAGSTLLGPEATRVAALRDGDEGSGFTVEEAADRLAATFRSIGSTRDLPPLVVLFGHGSTSINNPHEAAYDCGACAGKHGGPSARLFVELANQPTVRAALGRRGVEISEDTWFVAGEHDTSSDRVSYFDLHRIPAARRAVFETLCAQVERALQRDAHERCRRFESAPLSLTPERAHLHVEARAADLSEARPELGHATNAICVVGRRALTRGLFLDRRAFLVSYDPTVDADGATLGRILAAVGPVGAGIALEYYFSRIDNDRYGCGTKLPHNVTGLVAVMDGHASDVRTGLPWQMVELHEPVRLLVICESTPNVILGIAERQPEVGELVRNDWIRLVLVDPTDGSISIFDPAEGFEPYTPSDRPVLEVGSSADCYRGRRDCITPMLVVPRPLSSPRRGGRHAA